MTKPIQNHALRLYSASKRHKDPLTLLVPLLSILSDVHRAAPVVAAIRLHKPDAIIPDTPFFRQVEAIIAAESNRADTMHLQCPDSPDKLITDYHVTPASDQARADMVEYRKKHGSSYVGNRFVKPKRSDRHNDFTI